MPTNEPNLEVILASERPKAKSILTSTEANKAQYLALRALKMLHQDDWRSLLTQANAKVLAERNGEVR